MTLALQAPTATLNQLEEKKGWAVAMADGDLLPRQYRGKPANVMFAAEYADSLGISRIHVLTSIHVIEGKPSPSADLMAAMVRAHGHKLRTWDDENTETAHAHLIRSDDPDFTFEASFSMDDARKAKLDNKDNWQKYGQAMRMARAISKVVRMGAQDVMAGGIYTPEELGAVVDQEGNVIEHHDTPRPRQATATRPGRTADAIRADFIQSKDGADAWNVVGRLYDEARQAGHEELAQELVAWSQAYEAKQSAPQGDQRTQEAMNMINQVMGTDQPAAPAQAPQETAQAQLPTMDSEGYAVIVTGDEGADAAYAVTVKNVKNSENLDQLLTILQDTLPQFPEPYYSGLFDGITLRRNQLEKAAA